MTLEIERLSISYRTLNGIVKAVEDVSFMIQPGQCTGLVGESGSGKSATAQAILRLLPGNAMVTGSIRLNGEELTAYSEHALRAVRGKQIGMIFQDPHSALNPTMKIGKQIKEAIQAHASLTQWQMEQQIKKTMGLAGLGNDLSLLNLYPFQISGGMKQRVMIAIAIVNQPQLLIADEPTTALDAALQTDILQEIKAIQNSTGMSVLLISHDLDLVQTYCSNLCMMYRGRLVEQGTNAAIINAPQHPYTRSLLNVRPKPGQDRTKPLPVIEMEGAFR